MAAATDPPPQAQPLPPALPSQDLIASFPAPVLRLLILFARPIAVFRSALEVLAWKPERRVQSYLLVAAWWALCLGGEYAFMWLLPPLLFLPLLPLRRLKLGSGTKGAAAGGAGASTAPAATQTNPATTDTLLITLGDLHKIYAVLPPSLPPMSAVYARFQQLGARRLARGFVVLWLLWIVAGRFLGLHILLAIVGSTAILLPSPLLSQTVDLLSRSLAVRRLVTFLFVLVFGTPSDDAPGAKTTLGWLRSKWAWSQRPAAALDFAPVKLPEEEHAPVDKAGNPIYFRFDVFENQRWWMGLDWTSALLPQERPSWCDAHLFPVSPPTAFTLPPPSSIDVPSPTAADPRMLVRRTATWRWLDDDWTVFKNTTGAIVSSALPPRPSSTAVDPDLISLLAHDSPTSSSSAAELPTPKPRPSSGLFSTSPDNDSGHTRAPSLAEAAFAKGLGRLKNVAPGRASPITSPVKPSSASQRTRTGSEASTDQATLADDVLVGPPGTTILGQGTLPDINEQTDADGWVYGDNKWENTGAKGGLGKFTRRRRWQRRAVCTETVHRVKEPQGAGTTASQPTGAGAPGSEPLGVGIPSSSAAPGVGTTSRSASLSSATGAPLRPHAAQPSGLSVARKSVETRTPATSPQLPSAQGAPPPGVSAGSQPTQGHAPTVAPVPSGGTSSATNVSSRDEQLRLRLKKAMGSMGA